MNALAVVALRNRRDLRAIRVKPRRPPWWARLRVRLEDALDAMWAAP